MRHRDAQLIADRLKAALAGACERIEIAGSIRRQRAEVKDIELVAIPKWHERTHKGVQVGLDGVLPTERVNVLSVAIAAFIESGALQVVKQGTTEPTELRHDARYMQLWIPSQRIKVDLFVCTPETWGLNFAIRTGSADFAKALLARWKAITAGGRALDARLYRPVGHRAGIGGVVVPLFGEPEATPEEADVFRLCAVAYVPPEGRTDASVVQRFSLVDGGRAAAGRAR